MILRISNIDLHDFPFEFANLANTSHEQLLPILAQSTTRRTLDDLLPCSSREQLLSPIAQRDLINCIGMSPNIRHLLLRINIKIIIRHIDGGVSDRGQNLWLAFNLSRVVVFELEAAEKLACRIGEVQMSVVNFRAICPERYLFPILP